MKEALVKEWLFLNRKRRNVLKRIEKDQDKVAEVEKRINELKPYFEEKFKK